jgi:predicted O-methyltransferase YrrM
MPLDSVFLKIAEDAFDPYSISSGTEHVAPFLYSLIRLVRPRTVVELGSGYTTLFILKALADNEADVATERRLLTQKTLAIADLAEVLREGSVPKSDVMADWFRNGNKACAVEPGYYLTPYKPRMYSFEPLPGFHDYVRKMKEAVRRIGTESLFNQICGTRFSADALPSSALPLDLAWNDHDNYREFFEQSWPLLNPNGGLMLFHNVTAVESSWSDIDWMKKQRSNVGDLELLVLPEPHKMYQSSCAILRRTSHFKPQFRDSPADMLGRLERFMRGAVREVP